MRPRFAAVAVLAVVVTGPGPSTPDAAPQTTVAPSTTTPRPVSTRPPATTAPPAAERPGRDVEAGDGRMALTEIPAGYQVSLAARLDEDEIVGVPPRQLFVGPDARWSTGPWLMIDVAGDEQEIQRSHPFTRPPTALTVAGAPAVAGVAAGGIEQVVFRAGDQVVVVYGRGLPPGTALTVAERGLFRDGVVSVPASALPAGFTVRTTDDAPWWLQGWWTQPPETLLEFYAADRDGFITIGNRPYDGEAWNLEDAAFFLDDLRYLFIDGNAAVAGTIDGLDGRHHLLFWRAADRELFAAITDDLTLDEAIDVAAHVLVAGERGWKDDFWNDARADARGCCGTDALLASVEVPAVGALDGQHWRMHAEVREDEVGWYFDTDTSGLGLSSEQTAPTLEVGGSYAVAFDDDPFDVAAVAMLDRGQLGAVLRLTTTGTLAQSIDVPLQPIEGSSTFSPFIVAGAVVPWSDGGFTAQLLGPDGTTLLTRSDLDLP